MNRLTFAPMLFLASLGACSVEESSADLAAHKQPPHVVADRKFAPGTEVFVTSPFSANPKIATVISAEDYRSHDWTGASCVNVPLIVKLSADRFRYSCEPERYLSLFEEGHPHNWVSGSSVK